MSFKMVSGRQAQFDKQAALNKAMLVFWEKGFLGASLTDLTTAMGINKPSMYSAYGNKETLFIQAVDNYIDLYASKLTDALNNPEKPTKEVLSDYLKLALSMQCSPETPPGCFISVAATEIAGAELPEKAHDKIVDVYAQPEQVLTTFFEAQLQSGKVNSSKPAKQLALYVITFLHGLASMARNNVEQSQLEQVIDDFIDSLVI
jgi:AcrR family transcriptional regulator